MYISDETRNKISSQFRSICEHAQSLLEATSGELDEKTNEARAKLQESLDSIKDRYDLVEEKLAKGVNTTDRMIQDKPYSALGVSFAVGLALGLLLKRK